MNSSSYRDTEVAQEGSSDGTKIAPKPNFTTSAWSRLKDPRIVRVSRAFGGKDRHSKVCTVRGLKDRRVRLSVPTAIQLYDLQDRLGLSQPSKVVDWLLNVAKDEIDELPPLKIPFGSFGHDLQAMLNANSEGVKTNNGNALNWEDFWNPNKSKEVEGIQREENNHDHLGMSTFVQPSSFFPRNTSCLSNGSNPNGSLHKWDPSNLSLSQFGSCESMTQSHQQQDSVHDFNMNATGSQLFAYPPPPQTQSYFPCHDHNVNSGEFNQKQPNFQMLSSSSSSSSNFAAPLFTLDQGMRPFHLSLNPKLFDHGNEPNKGN